MRVLRTARKLAVVALLAAAFSTPVAVAQASDEPGAALELTWITPQVNNQTYTTHITCFPSGGGDEFYLDPEVSCALIAQANGNFAALPGYPFLDCKTWPGTPVRTIATGRWLGQPVRYDVVHPSFCEAKKALGPVYGW